jgi:hypothetical protein
MDLSNILSYLRDSSDAIAEIASYPGGPTGYKTTGLSSFADNSETDYNKYRSDRDDPRERRINTAFDKYNVAATWADENKYPAMKASYTDSKNRSWNIEGDKDKNYSIGTEKNGIETTLNHSPGYWGVGLKLTPAEMNYFNSLQSMFGEK